MSASYGNLARNRAVPHPLLQKRGLPVSTLQMAASTAAANISLKSDRSPCEERLPGLIQGRMSETATLQMGAIDVLDILEA